MNSHRSTSFETLPKHAFHMPLGKIFDLFGFCTIGSQPLSDHEPLCAIRGQARDLPSLDRSKSIMKSEYPTIGAEKRRVE